MTLYTILVILSSLWIGAIFETQITKGSFGIAIYRKDRILKEQALKNYSSVSVVECLLHCRGNSECKSFNYGFRNCILLSATLCDVKTTTLHEAVGYNYYDLANTPDDERQGNTWGYNQCTKQGKCAAHCLPKFVVRHGILTWQKSLEKCLGDKECSQLAMPRNTDENEQLRQQLSFEKGSYWIGVTDTEVQGSYRYYADLSPINRNLGHDIWAPGQPNNVSSENCVMLKEEDQMKWHDAACNMVSNYVCQCY